MGELTLWNMLAMTIINVLSLEKCKSVLNTFAE